MGERKMFTPDYKREIIKLVTERGQKGHRCCKEHWRKKTCFSRMDTPFYTLHQKFTADDFMIRVPDNHDSVTVRVIDQIAELVTEEAHFTVPLSQGMIKADPERDLLKISCIDFQANPMKQFVGLIKGFKMKRGAIASSMAWDLTNIIAVGVDETDIALAVNKVAELQGGAVVCADVRVLAELPLSIGCYLRDSPIEDLVRKNEEFQQAAAELGSPFANTHLTLMTLTSPAIPFFRIFEEGLVDI